MSLRCFTIRLYSIIFFREPEENLWKINALRLMEPWMEQVDAALREQSRKNQDDDSDDIDDDDDDDYSDDIDDSDDSGEAELENEGGRPRRRAARKAVTRVSRALKGKWNESDSDNEVVQSTHRLRSTRRKDNSDDDFSDSEIRLSRKRRSRSALSRIKVQSNTQSRQKKVKRSRAHSTDRRRRSKCSDMAPSPDICHICDKYFHSDVVLCYHIR